MGSNQMRFGTREGYVINVWSLCIWLKCYLQHLHILAVFIDYNQWAPGSENYFGCVGVAGSLFLTNYEQPFLTISSNFIEQ